MDVSVIIVNYNVRDFLEQALRSVSQASGNLDVETFVVDNHSVDGSVEMVRSRFPDVKLIANEENVGFARANNQALERSSGRYVLILNPDTMVREDLLDVLVRFLDDNPDAGAVGCKIINPDGSFSVSSRRSFPDPTTALFRVSGLSRLFPKSSVFGRYNLTYLPEDAVSEVDALSGSCMMVRRAACFYSRSDWMQRKSAADTSTALPPGKPASESAGGFLDEDFFMYGEDLDWCYRFQRAGWKIFYTPDTQVVHYKGESTRTGEMRYVRLFYGAMQIFLEKHYPGRYSRWFITALKLAVSIRAGMSAIGKVFKRNLPMIFEFLLLWALLAASAVWRASFTGLDFRPYYWILSPVYSLATVVAIQLFRGYPRTGPRPPGPLLYGMLAGFAFAATASFFIKSIAYSRLSVAVGFLVAGLVLLTARIWLSVRRTTPRRAVLLGSQSEANRLAQLLESSIDPVFQLLGYVESGRARSPENSGTNNVPRLGAGRELREILTVRKAEDVIFADADVTSEEVFNWMAELERLQVGLRIFPEGRSHVIGESLTNRVVGIPVTEVRKVLGTPRTVLSRRLFEISFVILTFLFVPIILLVGVVRLSGSRILVSRLPKLPAVLSGRRALVGINEEIRDLPPNVRKHNPAVFSILEGRLRDTDDPREMYLDYYYRQSATLDLAIIFRLLTQSKNSG